MDASHERTDLVWGKGSAAWIFGNRVCPGLRRCPGGEHLYTTRQGRRFTICEDCRLWREWQRRIEFERYCRTRPDGTLEEPDADDIADAARGESESRSYAAAAAEIRRRRVEIKGMYRRLVELAGEPFEPVYDDEVSDLLDCVEYWLERFAEIAS